MTGSHLDPSASTRRRFLRDSAAAALLAAGAPAIVPRSVLGAGRVPPSDKLLIGVIGTGGRGKHLIQGIFEHADAQVIAICDVTDRADYSRFYYRGESGRLPVQKLVEETYRKKSPDAPATCKAHIDFREMLEKEKSIDAVMVATPDHTHAVVGLAAIRLGKHLYCEKPLAHSIEEVRKMTEEARRAKVATQMGQQGHSGEGIRQICEWIWDGAIGQVREVHAWSDTGGWAGMEDRPKDTPPVPAGLDWELWLGPAAARPYHPAYTPYNWRGWWDFGTGGIGDMGCHNIDPAFMALKLKYPETVEAFSTRLSPETTPLGTIMRFSFTAREGMPAVKLTWYDGGLYPPTPEEFKPGEKFDGNGILFIGEKGKLLCGGWSRDPRLIPAERMAEYKQPAPTLPRAKGHDRDWIDAAKGGPPASANFDYSGPLAELVILGNVALRTGAKLRWDGPSMRAANAPEADRFIHPQYRAGWKL
jgi:predicted dehydrogenase